MYYGHVFRICTAAFVAAFAAMSAPAFAAAASPVLGAAQNAGPRYSIVDLGSFGGVYGQASSIDAVGTVAGASDPVGDAVTNAAAWNGTKGPVDLGTLGGPNSAVAWPNHDNFPLIAGVSETSQVEPLGEDWSCQAFFFPAATKHVCVGFVEWGGHLEALPTLGGYDGYAAGTNDFGQVVGWAETGTHDPTCEGQGVGNGQVLQFLPAVWNPPYRRAQALPTLPGDSDGDATAINDLGVAVGNSGECDQAVGRFTAQHVVMWDRGRITNIPYAPTLGGATWNTPTDISNTDEIVGFANLATNRGTSLAPHAFLWTRRTGMQDLGTLSGDEVSFANGVNDFGEIVGLSGARAFVYRDGSMTDLNALADASSASLYLVTANDVNDRGEIVGQACVLQNGACTPTSALVPYLAVPHRAIRAANALFDRATHGATDRPSGEPAALGSYAGTSARPHPNARERALQPIWRFCARRSSPSRSSCARRSSAFRMRTAIVGVSKFLRTELIGVSIVLRMSFICVSMLLAMTNAGIAAACRASAYHQLDFFVGDWTVFDKTGTQIATDLVTKRYGGCVIWEQWFGAHGSRGAGYSGYVSARHRWLQTFMDDRGTVLAFEGGLVGTSFIIGGPSYSETGIVEQNRVIFRTLPHGVVEEYWTRSEGAGAKPSVIFDGFFHPRRSASAWRRDARRA